MSQKMKFKPVVTRIKLNPEQAVLYCNCYSSRRVYSGTGAAARNTTCTRAGVLKGRVGRLRNVASSASS